MALRSIAARGLSRALVQNVPCVQTVQSRGMATEKQIWNQIQSTKNISKITASMKMVSAAKLKGDEKRLASAIPFNIWTAAISGDAVSAEDASFDDLPQKSLIISLTSDKGLCGGVNSFISRVTKAMITKAHADGKEADIVVIGDKGRSQLSRSDYASQIQKAVTDCNTPGNFGLVSALSAEILDVAKEKDYDGIVIIYNSFVNAAVYKQKYRIITPFISEGDAESLVEYEFEPDVKAEVLENLKEYLFTSQFYECFMDAAASEQSSRMTAMENASRNAGEMIDKLTLQYNRARQTRITTELIEIISGASALEDQ
uniref:ATP synthase subunit gamma, mitochondrial n=3 Tax=Corethron hystrix TaxID=216773 RepID=A0A6U5IY95_9STRA|mmetsp:Transcript_35411/g.82127  ORF Transcript_35411/g.82127 Transcript_35411/m.82127 type:complete len:315 (+) Transcript_35411:193-1137(+)|eukprot:CAMPEP_0113312438 /NCGR_PEP_ID=MMETSP0010_2-20120614/9276_1 /TAXON_ID=216773 ORGANISM="Corethron hystrix, Strain 308" /NCGR_SAMPLE_ID=MMETSP0010_2 /ASSEMBLY_ACC=CAM_ASM_000155 /LENGTH=314 /DNA_ID=CAMNT_0000168279 /DNA_START=157 /DNA_END=1101 /DNA_ORIENTATION=+ /assembly_acc=CAM_ASM_000155